MKKIILTLLIFIPLVASNNCFFSQKLMTIAESEKKYSKDSLQEIYFYRIMSEDINECFDASPEIFLKEWSKFSGRLVNYVNDNKFSFGKDTKVDIEVYFNKNEKIDYFFISVRDPKFPKENYENLLKILTGFSQDYVFTLDAKQPFFNAGTITFMY